MTITKPPLPAASTAEVSHADKAKPEMVGLDQLAEEMNVSPREARMMLRLAAKQSKVYPLLGKAHVARQPWQWPVASQVLEEAKKALSRQT